MSRMYTPGEIRLRRLIGSIFWSIIILMTAIHMVSTYREKETLKDSGYVQLVDVGKHKLNVSVFGNENGKHRIVAISGLKDGDFTISATRLIDELDDDCQLIFIDRAGYGLSEDSFQMHTAADVVAEYQRALEQVGIGGPYVLLAEHYGGVYATYWESCYPNEIEAVVFIDGTEMHESEEESRKADQTPYIWDGVLSFLARIGASKFLQSSEYQVYPSTYSLTEKSIGKSLTTYTLDSLSPVLEEYKQWDNIELTHASVRRNEVPKLYITSDEDWRHKAPTPSADGTGQEFGDVVRLTVKDPNDTLTPYLDQMGNCRLTFLGGIGHLYENRPTECAKIIKSFLSNLDHYKKISVN